MKTKHTLLLALCLLLSAALQAQNDTIKILAIGNSFADDGIEYLDEVARSAGKHIIVANTYIGGCSIERHLDNARHDRPAYHYRKNVDGQYSEERGTTLLEALKDEEWDYIVFQQVSSLAGQYSTYFPDLAELMDYVRAHATNPHVQYALQQTWAYAKNSTHPGFFRYGKNQQAMYDDVVFSYDQVAKRLHITIVIPTGTAIQNARSSSLGDTLCRDGYHLNLKYGRYTAACAWFETFFGESSIGIAYRPDGVTEQQAAIAQHAAHAAILCPTAVTDMSNY
ncbi:DUF4886 domain-containing protein [uncultured Barnesiella sp.]|uniref:DUF4886 domain-containing protein n=1 Tax=uncultured Barnesiella sp. TaxID=584861 RepID=UPI00260639FA|nr:DUF4886 domain-containing protein [uncultured Barnesiella sp.]